MAAMTCSLPLLLLLIDNGITASPAVDVISVDSGGAVRLCSDLSVAEQKLLHDLRWKHANLLLVLKDNVTKCHNGRCTLLPDGSLSYDRAEARDSGEYSMQAFDKDGKRFKTKEIFLRVDSKGGSARSRVATGSITTGCFLLFGFTLTAFIIKRKWTRLSRTAAVQENVYAQIIRCDKKEEELYCGLSHDFRETPARTQGSPNVKDV